MTDFAALTAQLVGFDWDRGNAEKSWARHGVSRAEAEEVFFNRPVLLAEDAKHSTRERRYNLLGLSNGGRLAAGEPACFDAATGRCVPWQLHSVQLIEVWGVKKARPCFV